MNQVVRALQKIISTARMPVLYIPVILFVCYYLVHFWLTLTNGNTLYGGPGDHTAGLIWLYDHYPQSPWWQFTSASGYPWGDSLWTPLFLTGQIGYILFWLFSTVFSDPVAGYNSYIALGLITSYVVPYMFIHRRIVSKPLVAAVSALLIISTPAIFYAISVGHPSYVYLPAYTVGLIWLLIVSFESKMIRWPIITGLFMGVSALFDPYYPLFAAAIATATVVSIYGYKWLVIRELDVRRFIKVLVLIFGGVIIIIAPVVLVMTVQSGGVSPISATSSIREGAYAYSAQPEDFLLPALDNPFLLEFLSNIKVSTFHGNDPTFTLFMGYVVLLLVGVALLWWVRNYRKTTNTGRLLVCIFLMTAILSFALSLPPTVSIFGLNIYMPTWLITEYVSAWRVFARFFFVIQTVTVLFLVVTLSEYTKTARLTIRRRQMGYMLFVLVAVITLIEYLPRNPFDATSFWSYEKNLPKTYSYLRETKASVIAEYPMREQPYYRGSMYITGQHIHNKSTINAYSPTNDKAVVRLNIMDLNNPQTIPTLRFLNVDSIVIWNNKYQNWSPQSDIGLKEAFKEKYISKFGSDTLRVYDIVPGNVSRYLGYIEKGFRPDDEALYDIPVPLNSGVGIGVIDLCEIANRADVCDGPRGVVDLRGSIVNTSNDNVIITIKDEQNVTVESFEVKSGQEAINFKADAKRYTIHFDPRYDEKIFYKNIHAVQNNES